MKSKPLASIAVFLLAALVPSGSHGQCPEAPVFQYYTSGGATPCPCFISGEEAGVVFTPPVTDYPLEILRVGIGWGSLFGGNPQSLEQGIHIYTGGLPDPGAPIFTLSGPFMSDGVINQFDLEPSPGEILIPSGPFTVTLEFLNQSAGNQTASSVIYDTDGCQTSSVIRALPGGWQSACSAGVPGDWVFYVVYRPCFPVGIEDEIRTVSNRPVLLLPPAPHPVRGAAQLEFFLETGGEVTVTLFDLRGAVHGVPVQGEFDAGWQRVPWDRSGLVPGIYWMELRSGGNRSVQKTVVL